MIQLTVVAAEARVRTAGRARGGGRRANARRSRRAAGQYSSTHQLQYKDDVPLIDDLSLEIASGQKIAMSVDGCRQDDAGQPADAILRRDRGAIRIDGIDIRELTRGALRQCSAWP